MKCIVSIDYIDYVMDVDAPVIATLLSARKVAGESFGIYTLGAPIKIAFVAVDARHIIERTPGEKSDSIPPFTILDPAPPAKPGE